MLKGLNQESTSLPDTTRDHFYVIVIILAWFDHVCPQLGWFMEGTNEWHVFWHALLTRALFLNKLENSFLSFPFSVHGWRRQYRLSLSGRKIPIGRTLMHVYWSCVLIVVSLSFLVVIVISLSVVTNQPWSLVHFILILCWDLENI